MTEPRQRDNERHVGDDSIENPRIDNMQEMLSNIREHLATTGPFTWGNTVVNPPGPDTGPPEQQADHGMEM